MRTYSLISQANSSPKLSRCIAKTVLTTKIQIGKPLTKREGVKQMKDVRNVSTIRDVWSNMCFETFAWLQSTDECNTNWCGLL